MSKPRRAYPTSSYLQSNQANQQSIGETAPQAHLYPTSYNTAVDHSQQQSYQQPQQTSYQQPQSNYHQPQQSYQQPQYHQPNQDQQYQQQPIYPSNYQPVDSLTQGVAGLGITAKSQVNMFNLQSGVPPVSEVLDFVGPKIGLNVIIFF